MSRTASVVLLFFTLKLVAALLVGRSLRRTVPSAAESLLGGWVVVQLSLYAIMLALSCFDGLGIASMWLALLTIFAVAAWSSKGRPELQLETWEKESLACVPTRITLLLVAVVFATTAYRNFLFLDNTWDGMTTMLPRILFYAQRGSLFVHEPTQQVNLFSNEWNSELNALTYLLATGHDQGAMFANVEVWLVACLAATWLSSLLGAGPRTAPVIGFLVASSPTMLGLVFTFKGELLATAMLCATFGWFLRIAKQLQPVPLMLCFASLGLCAGSKISMLPPLGLLLLVIVGYVYAQADRLVSKPLLTALFGGAAAMAIGTSRYWINWLHFGTPLQRVQVAHEAARLTFDNLRDNVLLFLSTASPFHKLTFHPEAVWVLSLGFGWTIVAAVGSWMLFRALQFSSQTSRIAQPEMRRPLALGFGALAIGMLIFLAALTSAPWVVRYFAAVPLFASIYLLSSTAAPIEARSRWAVHLALFAGAWNCAMIVAPGETVTGPTVAQGVKDVMYLNANARKAVAYRDMCLGEKGLYRVTEKPDPQRLLVLNAIDSNIAFLFGANRRNWIDLADSFAMLDTKRHANQYDGIVVAGVWPPADLDRLNQELTQHGYTQSLRVVSGTVHRHTVFTLSDPAMIAQRSAEAKIR